MSRHFHISEGQTITTTTTNTTTGINHLSSVFSRVNLGVTLHHHQQQHHHPHPTWTSSYLERLSQPKTHLNLKAMGSSESSPPLLFNGSPWSSHFRWIFSSTFSLDISALCSISCAQDRCLMSPKERVCFFSNTFYYLMSPCGMRTSEHCQLTHTIDKYWTINCVVWNGATEWFIAEGNFVFGLCFCHLT